MFCSVKPELLKLASSKMNGAAVTMKTEFHFILWGKRKWFQHVSTIVHNCPNTKVKIFITLLKHTV